MSNIWPRELSTIINDYAGYIQTQAQIDRDEKIEATARKLFCRVKSHIDELRDSWTDYVAEGAKYNAENAWDEIKERRDILESMGELDSDNDDDEEEVKREVYNQFMADNAEISPDTMTAAGSGYYSFILTNVECIARQSTYRGLTGDELALQFAAMDDA